MRPLVWARRVWRAVRVEWPARAAAWRARGLPADHAVASWPGPHAPLGPDVALFVHFDPDGVVRPRVLRYLAALREAGRSVAFVTNAGRLEPRDAAAVRAMCDAVLVRANVGYDFGAMREGLAHWGLPREGTRSVLLVNDSLLGPFAPLGPVLARIDFAAADVWGATDTRQRAYHLQSFFLAVGRRALDHPAWAAFWRDVRPVASKEWVIGQYEVGLTRRLQAAGLRCRALFPFDDLLARMAPGGSAARLRHVEAVRRALARGDALNPTMALWRELLRAGFPFVKRELVGPNPARIGDAAEWRAELGDAASHWS